MKSKNYFQKSIVTGNIALLLAMLPLQTVTVFAVTAAPAPSLLVKDTPDVFITEVQTATASSAGEEFIELFNATDHPIDFADAAHGGKDVWKLQYFSGSKLTAGGVASWSTPTGSIDLAGMTNPVIDAHEYYVLATVKTDGSAYQPGGIEADGRYSAKLSDNIGLQLVDIVGTTAVSSVHDRVVWQKPAASVGVLTAPPAGSSLQRIPNDDDEYVNADNTLTTFSIEPVISPRDLWQPPTETDDTDSVQTTENQDPENTTSVAGAVDNTGLLSPTITELLPNPAAPQTDAHDEFIELYNPNAAAFDLNGYTLETGSTTLHDFTFTTSTVLAAHSYQAFFAADTHISLTNTGGQVRLLDRAKNKISETAAYAAAPDGKAWALVDAIWQWTSEPTPNSANVLSMAAVATTTTTKQAAADKKKISGKNTVKVAKAKTVKVKKTKTVKKTTKKKKAKKSVTSSPKTQLASVVQPTPIHAGVLAAVAAAALLYALYEYRVDLANYFHRLRGHHQPGRKTGRKATRR